MDPRIRRLIDRYDLRPLPVEGVLVNETYRSPVETSTGGPAGTAIVGLYSEDPPSWSTFHRLSADEVWHFYDGDPLRLILLAPDGSSRDVVMGRDEAAGQVVQAVVPAGTWQAGHLVEGGAYALFGCTMAPGFTSAGFEGATVDVLVAGYPDRASDIRRLAPPDGVTRMPDDLAT